MVAPIGKVGWIRSRYIRFPPSSTIAIDAPSLPFFASAAAAAATALAPSRVRTFFVWVTWACAETPAAERTRMSRDDALIRMMERSSSLEWMLDDVGGMPARRE